MQLQRHSLWRDIDVTAIATVRAEDSTPATEYYTLSGVRVSKEKATNGLFIVKQGGNKRKVIF